MNKETFNNAQLINRNIIINKCKSYVLELLIIIKYNKKINILDFY